MAKRRKKPPELGLYMAVSHPASETWRTGTVKLDDGTVITDQEYAESQADDDGHEIGYGVSIMRGSRLVSVEMRRGMAPATAALVLRKLAGIIEANPRLLSARLGECGEIRNGVAEKDPSNMDDHFDDFGNLTPPEPE